MISTRLFSLNNHIILSLAEGTLFGRLVEALKDTNAYALSESFRIVAALFTNYLVRQKTKSTVL